MRPEDIYILVGCEESQAITKAFRALGVQAFSCDLKPCSGGHPEWHYWGDVFNAISCGYENTAKHIRRPLITQDGKLHWIQKWHGGIFHPDCTYLTVSGLHWNKRVPGRAQKTEDALDFVRRLLDCEIENILLENPVSCISSRIRKPDQIIQPYEFGDDASKKTCLWLKNFPKLKLGQRFNGRIIDGKERWSNQTDSGQNKLGPSDDRAELRSKTYQGIAEAIATQYTQYLINNHYEAAI